jgi:hypothetical protein
MLMTLVPNDRVEQFADFVPPPLKHLQEEVLGDAQQTRHPNGGVFPTRLLQNGIESAWPDVERGATGVETSNKHLRLISSD